MPIYVAEHAGFCAGVRSAVRMAEQACRAQTPVYVLGELIHNPQVIQDLQAQGLVTAQTPHEIPEGATVLLRSHGSSPVDIAELLAKQCRLVDATCPHVKRVHRLVESFAVGAGIIYLAGAEDHPETVATAAHAQGHVCIIENAQAAECVPIAQPALLVAQTTLPQAVFDAVATCLLRRVPELLIHNTICNATAERQQEAETLARGADCVIVIGGRHSANTQALADTCRRHCKRVLFIESAAELRGIAIPASDTIVVTAGASTPGRSLKEVLAHMMDQEHTDNPIQEAVVDTVEAVEAPVEAAPRTVEVIDTPPMEPIKPEDAFLASVVASMVSIRPGQTVTGTVVQITEDEVCVNIGYKSDGLVKMSDMITEGVKIGDEIDVEVVKVNDGEGNVILSQRNIVNRKVWDALMAKYEAGAFIDGVGKEAVKGGLICNVDGIRAFVPASQLSDRFVEKIDTFVGQPMKLKIIEVDKAKKRIVCSRKQAAAEEIKAKKQEIWGKLVEGSIVHGVVRRLTDFGAFVDIGGIDGLVHVTDLSWGRVKHPSDVVQPNQEIDVQIISLDPERERIQLGYKQLQSRPWDVATEKYPAGIIVDGKVVRATTFGAFVELEPGLDGLVHISQCALSRIAKVEDAVAIGQMVRVKVLSVDPEAKRISLSIRAALEEEAFSYESEIPGEELGFDNDAAIETDPVAEVTED